ncbi:thiol:disulfide interchange protein DsbD [Bacteroidia bacterium]|nr:thiol:disulfide interchange protein DsbD [Bacteroidia bacterium]
MKKAVFLFSLLYLLSPSLASISVQAQVSDPTNWHFSQKSLGNGIYELSLKATLAPTWSIYSMYTPDGGPFQTILTFDKVDADFIMEGKATENEPSKKFDDIFGVEVWSFHHEYSITQKVKVLRPAVKVIRGSLEYQVCQEEQCILFDKSFEIAIEIEKGHPSEQKIASGEINNIIVKQSLAVENEAAADDSLWLFFWLSFLAGLAAVIMPCVFPMIPMTVLFFMHGKDVSKAQARLRALFFSFSIIVIYTVFGLLISVLLGPDFINWLSTNWLPNILFFVIFMVFAASFFGAFEIVLPSRLVNKADKQADRDGYIGSFFMAFTLVLVSFSCTVPIVGTVLVEAARGSVLRPIIGMLGFSLAVALPFGFFALFPSKLSKLPKSGGWLNSVKVVLGFIEVALGFKFLMVADQTYHWGLLDREVYIAIWIVVFFLQGLYLLGKIKFKNDSALIYIGVGRLVAVLATFTFVIYLIPGMFGAPLKALAGYLPPQESIDFDVNRIVRENVKGLHKELSKSGGNLNLQKGNELCEEPKYGDFLHLPHGLEGYFDFKQGLMCAKAQDKPIFIDFTGHGCVNCREMEQSVWSDPRILNLLKNEYVVIALYVDDKFTLDKADWQVGKDGKTKKTLGKKNADFQITHFNSNAQPNYILFDSRYTETHDHSSLLTDFQLQPSRAYSLDKNAFYEFLCKGITAYKERGVIAARN